MKKLLIIAILSAGSIVPVHSQQLNWAALPERPGHLINLNAGWDYATSAGLGYGYIFNAELPVVISAQVSIPAGKDKLDDLKVRAGGQVRLFKAGGFAGSVSLFGIYRQYKSDFVRLQNFGSDMRAELGYYRERWYTGVEFGFDKAIATRIINSEILKGNFPSVTDGWYVPTGGNFRYGLQAGYSIERMDFYGKLGKVRDQEFNASALIPFYAELGVNVKF